MRLQAAKTRLLFGPQILFDDMHITVHKNLLGGVRDQILWQIYALYIKKA
jgi:hypothetical protein